jgi:hypothetical protein
MVSVYLKITAVSVPGVTSAPVFKSAYSACSPGDPACRAEGLLQRVMDKLRLCMVPVKPWTQYIVLFFQMSCSAVKLLWLRVLPLKRPVLSGF